MNRMTITCALQRTTLQTPTLDAVRVESGPMSSLATPRLTPRPIIAEFSGRALRQNAERVRALIPVGARTLAVIKADAYGHGLLEVAERLLPVVDGFAVLELAAARSLRAQGYVLPIVMLEGFFAPDELPEFSALQLATVIHRADQIHALSAWSQSPSSLSSCEPLDVYLKINTGMNRLGFPLSEAPTAFAALQSLPQVRSVTVMTHFADADNTRGTGWQLDRLQAAWPKAHDHRTSFANSAALLSGQAGRTTLGDDVRPGIMLYGASPWGATDPARTAQALGLLPVMTLKSEVIAIQTLTPGDRIGYGGTFVATAPMKIGVVACGYADGYPRHGSNQAPILVDGVRTRVVGRVSMDMLCCDLTSVPEARVGAPVTLWGNGLPADEVADAAGTIAYELFCGVTARVPRIWVD